MINFRLWVGYPREEKSRTIMALMRECAVDSSKKKVSAAIFRIVARLRQ